MVLAHGLKKKNLQTLMGVWEIKKKLTVHYFWHEPKNIRDFYKRYVKSS